MKIKTRFCPSPTGYMHLGNVRTALFSKLFTMSRHGDFLLRIEDTDKERSEEIYTKAIKDDLRWLGLEWEEGPEHHQGNGPYFQSMRQDIYDKYYAVLEGKGQAYPCFCSEQQLAITRKTQLASGRPPRYPGTCRSLTKEQIEQKIANGEKPTLRFHIPEGEVLQYIDFVKGEQRFETDDLGDFIIRRADGTPPFMYCNAIDDALMGVTHVIRGEDHVTNTPRQILILKALDLPVPEYGHISLIMGYDGAPLSKRHGSSSIHDLREQGFLPEAVINYLARLGHYYEDNSFMKLNELADKFKLDSLSKSSAKFDMEQLHHWQKLAVQLLDEDGFWDWMEPITRELVPEDRRELFIKTVMPNVVFPVDALRWATIFFDHISENDPEQQAILQKAGRPFFEVALKALAEKGNDAKAVTAELKKELGVKGKELFMPLRVALTGEIHGPELVGIFELLGEEKVRERLEHATNL